MTDENFTQFTMRMENKIYAGLKARAERNRRSIAKELEHITEQALKSDEKELEERLKKLLAAMEEENIKEGDLLKLFSDPEAKSTAKAEMISLLQLLGVK